MINSDPERCSQKSHRYLKMWLYFYIIEVKRLFLITILILIFGVKLQYDLAKHVNRGNSKREQQFIKEVRRWR